MYTDICHCHVLHHSRNTPLGITDIPGILTAASREHQLTGIQSAGAEPVLGEPASHADKDFDHLLSMLQNTIVSEARDSSAAAPGAMHGHKNVSMTLYFLPYASKVLTGVQCRGDTPCSGTVCLPLLLARMTADTSGRQ